ncbi:MAG: phage tail tape measure protein [Clostridium beijerinckii]|nr:phage tail tape measure protein [Clostridium beijerinckii]
MAINVGTAVAYLDLDMSGFKNSLASAGTELKTFTTGGDIQGLGNAMNGVGSELTKNVTLPIAGIGAAAVGASMDFEAQMSKVKAISGAVGEEFDGLRNQAIQLGADTNFSASEAASGMENLASAGFKTQEIMAAMPGMLDLAAAGGVNISDASDIAASTLRGFGMEAKDVTHVADALAKAAGDTNAEIMDTGDAMKYIAPVAHSLGLSFEDTTAAIGMLSNAGIKGSQAGTTLRGALVNLAKPTDSAAKLMENLGMNFFNAQGKLLPMTDIIQILKDKTSGLTQEQKASAFAVLFGKEAMSGMLALVDQGPDKFKELTDTLKNCDGASKEMAGTMQDNLKGSIEAMKGSIETAAIKIGDVLAPMIKSCAGWIADLVNKFSALSPETQAFIVKMALVAAAIGPVLIVLAKLIESVRTVISVFTGISKIASIVSALPGAIASPVGAVVGIIMLIAIVVYEVIKHWDSIKAYFSNLFTWLKNVFGAFWGWLTNFFSKWGPTILAIIAPFLGIPLIIWQHWSKIKEWLQPIFDWMINAFDKVVSFFSNGIAGLKATFDDFKSWASGIGKNICEGLVHGLEAGWDWVFEKVGNMADKIKTIFAKILDIHSPSRVFRGYGKNIGEGLVLGIDDHDQTITERFKGLGNKIKDLGNVKPNFNFGNAAGAYNGSSSFLNNAPKQYTFSPEIHMRVSIADTGSKGIAQLTSELKNMAQTAVKNSMVDEFMDDALRL